MRLHIVPLLGVLTVLITLAVPPTSGGTAMTGAAASVAAFTPGSPGVGDPYFPTAGNGGYDVDSYDLALRYDPASDRLSGTATIRARASMHLSAFDLDLDGLDVRAVSVNGVGAAWTRSGTELVITPATGLPTGRAFTVAVRYIGIPTSTGRSGFMATDDGVIVAGEPEVAATWFPVNDHPRDRAAYAMAITVPTDLQVIANGVPLGRVAADPGWSTWRSRAAEPMAAYLATIAVGSWDITSRTVGGTDYLDAIDVDMVGTRTGDIAAAAFARQPEILAFLAGIAGPYPFSAAGGILDDYADLGFALETQTRPVYARSFFGDAD
nr:M1 family peptidase [Geodermatophilaceae bacterium]